MFPQPLPRRSAKHLLIAFDEVRAEPIGEIGIARLRDQANEYAAFRLSLPSTYPGAIAASAGRA